MEHTLLSTALQAKSATAPISTVFERFKMIGESGDDPESQLATVHESGGDYILGHFFPTYMWRRRQLV